ncbi:SDR family oxidoreductase [Microbacterium sp. HJ5]
MRIVVLGGTGLIGSLVVERLRTEGHEAIVASPSTGVDAAAGTGLNEALAGADALVDVTNPRDFGERASVDFFTASARNLLAAEERAGVRHHVVLSIVGVDRDPGARGYLAGKVAQERLVQAGTVPYTIVRATQFFEFLADIADGSTVDGVVRVAPVALQPVAASAVAKVVTDAALATAAGVVEVAGPDREPLAAFLGRLLAARGDAREIVEDPAATGYFGRTVVETSLVPVGEAIFDPVTLEEWLERA